MGEWQRTTTREVQQLRAGLRPEVGAVLSDVRTGVA
jgi:hypothetical protein